MRNFTGTPESPNPEFNYTFIKKISLAAAGLCDWVVNVLIYHDIFLEVEPKRRLLQEAEAKLADANARLAQVTPRKTPCNHSTRNHTACNHRAARAGQREGGDARGAQTVLPAAARRGESSPR